MKKIFIFCLQILSFYTFAFEWPQEEKILSDSFYSYFGQLRGNTISSSLIFTNPLTALGKYGLMKHTDEGE